MSDIKVHMIREMRETFEIRATDQGRTLCGKWLGDGPLFTTTWDGVTCRACLKKKGAANAR